MSYFRATVRCVCSLRERFIVKHFWYVEISRHDLETTKKTFPANIYRKRKTLFIDFDIKKEKEYWKFLKGFPKRLYPPPHNVMGEVPAEYTLAVGMFEYLEDIKDLFPAIYADALAAFDAYYDNSKDNSFCFGKLHAYYRIAHELKEKVVRLKEKTFEGKGLNIETMEDIVFEFNDILENGIKHGFGKGDMRVMLSYISHVYNVSITLKKYSDILTFNSVISKGRCTVYMYSGEYYIILKGDDGNYGIQIKEGKQ